MRGLFFLFLALFFSFSIFASTLIEMGAATAIANKLQETGQAQQAPLVKQVKEQVEQYEAAEKNKMESLARADTPQITEQGPQVSPAPPKPLEEQHEVAEKNEMESLARADTPQITEQGPQVSPTHQAPLEEQHEATEKNETENLPRADTPPFMENPEVDRSPQSLIAKGEPLEHSIENEIEEEFRDQGIEADTNPVDYKSGMQVFYKNTCTASQKNCRRGAVLTNIKSVIFNYAHSRGIFAKSQEK